MTIEIPPPPADPPTVHLADQQQDTVDAPADNGVDTPVEDSAPRPAASSGGRIPDWWSGERVALGDADVEPEPVCEHPEPLEVYDPFGELVAYLCPACDAQLPADTDTEEESAPEPYDGLVERGRSAASKASGWLPAGAKGVELNPRARRLLYNGSAAGLGWYLHIGPPIKHAIESCGREAGIGASLVLGVGICGVIAVVVDRRTRHWWPPLAWVCRAPLASAVLALCLYAPASI